MTFLYLKELTEDDYIDLHEGPDDLGLSTDVLGLSTDEEDEVCIHVYIQT